MTTWSEGVWRQRREDVYQIKGLGAFCCRVTLQKSCSGANDRRKLTGSVKYSAPATRRTKRPTPSLATRTFPCNVGGPSTTTRLGGTFLRTLASLGTTSASVGSRSSIHETTSWRSSRTSAQWTHSGGMASDPKWYWTRILGSVPQSICASTWLPATSHTRLIHCSTSPLKTFSLFFAPTWRKRWWCLSLFCHFLDASWHLAWRIT
mmetsp:Transcript_36998/g.98570  ORF Transcript_36998/g.98570 Transcript_36998/m.98570 type:complete len:206 (-) Transcript_36998:146-763(-)